jgi:transposase
MPMPAPGCSRCAELAELVRQLRMQVQQLQGQVQQLQAQVHELRARLNTHSGNSSLPPSANPPGAPKAPAKPPTGRKPGGQPGHPGHARFLLPPERIQQVVRYVPTVCARCQASLPAQAGPGDPDPVRHQVAELPSMLATVTEHQGHGRACVLCGHVTWAAIPPQVLAHGLGPNLTAAIAFLSGRCHASKRLIAEMVQTLFGVPLSLGGVVNAQQEVAAALEQPYAQVEATVQEAQVKYADETGWALAGKLCWLWMAVIGQAALFKVCLGRGREALRQLLGPTIRGTVASDRWTAYGIIDLGCRQVCWAHLKRDFQKWVDWGGQAQAIGQAGLEAVQRLFELWGRFREGVLDRAGLQAALTPVMTDLQAALEAGRSCPLKRAARFCHNLLAVYPALWTFARVEGVEPTNNLAERTLRTAVIWRKLSFGNCSQGGCRFAERILTATQTLRLQGRDVLGYLRQAVAAHRAGQAPPSLVPPGA